MKVLVVDSGGRGHSIAWQFKNDPYVKEVICAPGNAGISREIRCENARRNDEILDLVKRNKVDLVFIGPERQLSEGIVDLFLTEQIPIIGPTKKAAFLKEARPIQNYSAEIQGSLLQTLRSLKILKEPRIMSNM